MTLKQADSAGNVISTVAWLPAPWNGRFQGVGGSCYSCGINESALAGGIQDGYATASTDCGIPAGHERTGQWGLRPDNTLNRPLINDFAYAGIHDMSVTGKAVTTAYYSQDPAYSYFQGCSTGGREGLMEAQRYPATTTASCRGPGDQLAPVRPVRAVAPARHEGKQRLPAHV